MTAKKYFILQTFWHEAERRHAYPGEIVSLDHLAAEQIALLEKGNVITPDTASSSKSIAGSAAVQPAAKK